MIYKLIVLQVMVIYGQGRIQHEIVQVDQISEREPNAYYEFNMYTQINTTVQSSKEGPNLVSIARLLQLGSLENVLDYTHTFLQDQVNIHISIQNANRHVFEITKTYDEYSGNWYFLSFRYRPYDQSTIIQLYDSSNSQELIFQQVYSQQFKFNIWEVGNLNNHSYQGIVRYQMDYIQTENFINFIFYSVDSIYEQNNKISQDFNEIQELQIQFCYEKCIICNGMICIPCYDNVNNKCDGQQKLQIHEYYSVAIPMEIYINNVTIENKVLYNKTILSLQNAQIPVKLNINNFKIIKCNFNFTLLFDIDHQVNLSIWGLSFSQTFIQNITKFMLLPQETQITGLTIKQCACNQISFMSFYRNFVLSDVLIDGFFISGHTFIDGASEQNDDYYYYPQEQTKDVIIRDFLIRNMSVIQAVVINLYQYGEIKLNVTIQNFQILYSHNVDRVSIFYISVYSLFLNNFLINLDRNCRYFDIHRVKYLTVQNGFLQGKVNQKIQLSTLFEVMDGIQFIFKNITIQNIHLTEKYAIFQIEQGIDYRTEIIILKDIRIINISVSSQQTPLIDITQSIQDKGNIKLKNIFIRQVWIERTQMNLCSILSVKAIFWMVKLSNFALYDVQFLKDQLSSLYIETNNLIVKDSTFNNIGILSEENIAAKGGLGYFKTVNLSISNTTFRQCQGSSGGAIYLQALRNSFIYIENSQFIQNSASLGQLIRDSQGGSIYIDAQNSDKLQLFMENLEIVESYSYFQGGFMYINPSKKENCINIQNILGTDIHSQQSSFIHFYSDKQSQVIMKNITIDNQLDYFNTYLGLLKYQIFSQNTGIFSIQAKTIQLDNINFTGYGLQSVISIQVTESLHLNQIKLLNSIIQDVQLIIIQVTEIIEDINNIIIGGLSIVSSQIQKQEQSTKRLLSQDMNKIGFIQINLQQQMTSVIINDLFIQDNVCLDCQNGFLNFYNNNSESILIIDSSLIQENTCDYNFITINGLIKTTIMQTFFSHNLMSKLSLLNVKKSPILMKNTYFLFNEVQSFEVDSQSIRLQDSIIILPQKNTPKQSYKINGRQPRMTQLDLINRNENFEVSEVNHKNNATLLKLAFNDNLFKTVTQKSQYYLYDITKIDPFNIYGTKQKQQFILLPSNNKYPQQYYDPYQQQYYSYDLNYTIFALDIYGEMAQINDNATLKVTTQLYDFNQSLVLTQIDQQNITYDPEARGFKLQNINVQFNPYNQPQVCLQLMLQCDCITNNYSHFINIRTFRCNIGEYLYNDQCKTCDVGLYQYQVKPDQNICLVADLNILEQFELNKVKLRKGYWRENIKSSQYLYCENNQDACKGGWQAADNSCDSGYIGPLCEECDNQNIYGNGYYQKQSSNRYCIKCGNQLIWFIKTISMIIWILISTLVTVNNIQIQTLQYLQYFLQYKQFDILYRLNQNQTNTVIKIFINFVQIIQMIEYLQIQNLKQFYNPLEFISNPVSSSSYNLDCLLFSHETDVEPQYIKLIIFIIVPFMLITIFNIIQFVHNIYARKIQKQDNQPFIAQKANYQSILYTSILYLLFYLQPDIVKQLSYFASFRQISDAFYVKGYLLLRYFSKQHIIWMGSFIIPALCIFTITIPLIVFYSLYKIKNKLFQKQNRYKFSYMFNEYRQNSYFWEIYKILQREVIIIIVILMQQKYTLIKIWILFAILSLYQQVLKRFNPYNQGKLNRFEAKCIEIVLIIFCTLSLLQTTEQSQQTIIYIIQILFFLEIAVLLLFNIFKLIQCYKGLLIDKFINLYKVISIKYPRIDYSLPQISNWMQVREQYKGRLNNLSKQLKGYLKERGRQASYLRAGTETYSQKNANTTFADRNLNEFPMNRLQTLVDMTIINNTQIQDFQQ